MPDVEDLDYSRYYWQGEKVRLRPLRPEDAEQDYADSLDTPSRQALHIPHGRFSYPASADADAVAQGFGMLKGNRLTRTLLDERKRDEELER
jgi:hypothetical protein